MSAVEAPSEATAASLAADAHLALAIDRWLMRLPRLDHRFIGIVVWEGAVTLSGIVDSERARQRTCAAVAGVPGVVAVRDRLRVRKIVRN